LLRKILSGRRKASPPLQTVQNLQRNFAHDFSLAG
jgi:hypothetical protein